MHRGLSAALGLVLAALWLVSLSLHATTWLSWANATGAVLAVIVAGVLASRESALATATLQGALAAGLFTVWLVALATGATVWLAWCDFAAACACLLSALACATDGWTEG